MDDFLGGGSGFAFEPPAAFWKIRCLVVSVLPLAVLRGSMFISLIFG